ncbi:MAG: glycosyltransferase family 4 protein [Candidatus Pacebacteria bacterium]|nr:glycosyltransferase family 4 protein [Candidatus Paceibacterota bacterium]
MHKVKPLIVSRTLPYLGGREVMVDKLIKFFTKKNTTCVLTPDKYRKQPGVNICSTNKSNEEILNWVKRQNISVINCHTFYLADLAIYISKKLHKPLVFTLHGVFVDHYGEKYGKLLKKIWSKSDLVITVSSGYSKKLRTYLGKKTAPMVIKNGIELESIDHLNKSKKFYRKKNKLPVDKFIVIVPARLTYLKGLDYLMKAFDGFSDKDILVLVCSPKGRKSGTEDTYQNNLKGIIKNSLSLIEFRNVAHPSILEYYKSADVVLLSSLIEGISISLLEAMACSRTVVATDVGGNPEIIKNNRNGYLIKPKNPKAIIEIIKKLKRHNNISMGRNARKTIERHFLSSKMFKTYEEVFKKIKYENK